MVSQISNCCQIVAKIGVWRKRKTPKLLFYNNLGVLFCGATGIRTRDTRIFSPLLYQLSYGTIVLLCLFLVSECKDIHFFLFCKLFREKFFNKN